MATKLIIALILIVFLLLAIFAPRAINDLANFLRDIFGSHVSVH